MPSVVNIVRSHSHAVRDVADSKDPKRRPSFLPVERVHKLAREAFSRDYDRAAKPVVVSGAVDHWKARSRWSHAWFKSNYGDRIVPIAVGPRLESRWVRMQLGDFIDNSAQNGKQENYLRQFPVLTAFPELADDFDVPLYCPSNRRLITNLWLGPCGTVQPLHKDNHNPLALINNILVQVVGRKRILLISGDQDRFVYQRAPSQKDYHYSQVDVENPNFECFPLFRQAVILEATLAPGTDIEEFGGMQLLSRAVRTLRTDLRFSFLAFCDATVRNELTPEQTSHSNKGEEA